MVAPLAGGEGHIGFAKSPATFQFGNQSLWESCVIKLFSSIFQFCDLLYTTLHFVHSLFTLWFQTENKTNLLLDLLARHLDKNQKRSPNKGWSCFIQWEHSPYSCKLPGQTSDVQKNQPQRSWWPIQPKQIAGRFRRAACCTPESPGGSGDSAAELSLVWKAVEHPYMKNHRSFPKNIRIPRERI